MLPIDPPLLGFVAGAFTTFSSIPQIVKVVRTRSADDLSPATLCMYNFGVILWIVYGFMVHSMPVVYWNIVALCLYSLLLVLKLNHGSAAR